MKPIHTLSISCILSFLIISSSYSQEDEETFQKRSPFQVTFVTPLGTNGISSPGILNEFSFNVLVGVNGGVDGFEFGGLVNIDNGPVDGAQVSGFGNIVTGRVEAFQLAGFANINDSYTEGFQGAGFINIVDDNADAFQIAGFANITGRAEGMQLSGFGNYAEKTEGLQAAGFMNISGKTEGAQVAGFMNVAEKFEGLQASGFINIADKVEGVQIAGFINICDSIDGIPIAPISIVKKNGYRRFEFWSNETFYINTSFRIGVPKFHTIFTVGYKPGYSDFNWGLGFGAGTSFAIADNHSVDLEGHVYHVSSGFWRRWEYNQLNQVKLNFNYQIAGHFSLFAGPTFNILISESDSYAHRIAPVWSFLIAERRNSVRGWFGFNLGFRF
ncbi:MAG TPA: hypothetical protein VJ346_01455 [Bacteroidales bacterium]|nr:hypothetical protein [Bacteroidales bacterium]